MFDSQLERSLAGHLDQLSPLRGTTVTVTGGTGFVGTWVAEAIAHLNDHHGFGSRLTLIGRRIDRFSVTRPHLATRPDLQLVSADVRHLVELPRDTAWLVHAAGNPDNRFHASNPLETMRVIADGTAAVLAAAERCSDLRRVLALSSALVYGVQPVEVEQVAEAAAELAPPLSASSAYAEAKRYAEVLCLASRSQSRLPCSIARPFTFVGPYHALDTPWALNSFIRDALTGGPIRVLGSGRTVRSFLFGSDVAAWVLALLVASEPGRAYNLGSPHSLALADAAAIVASMFDPAPDVLLNTQAGTPVPESRLVPDTAAAGALGLEVRVGFEEAVGLTIDWQRGRLGAEGG